MSRHEPKQPRQQSAAIRHIEIDQRVLMAVDAALKQGHRISPCSNCGGPEIHSKERPASKCWRCGAFRETSFVAAPAKRCRCLRCRRIFRSVVVWKHCQACRESVAKRAAKIARRGKGPAPAARNRRRNRNRPNLRGHSGAEPLV